MMQKLLQNPTWLKVFSFAIALLLWAAVVPRFTQDTSSEFEVPLEVVYHPEFQLDEGPQDRQRTVTVEVKGKSLLVSKVKPDMLWARADYSKIKEPGKQQQVEVQVGGQLEGLKYTASPRLIPVTLIVRTEAVLPVQVEAPTPNIVVQGDKEWSFVARPEVDQVTFSGRADYLNQVVSARVVLDKADLQPGMTTVVKPVIPSDKNLKTVDKLSPVRVNVNLKWTELPPGKAFKVQAPTRGTLPQGLVVTGTEAQPDTVVVRAFNVGAKLPEREVVETEPIDLTGRRQSFTTTAKVVPPQGTTVTVQTVNIKVNISEITLDKVLKGIPLTVRGAASNAQVAPAITDVQLRVRGPFSIVNGAEVRDFSAYVDVEGLALGKHTLPVKVAGPSGLVVEADPAVVEVTISAP